MVIEAKRDLGPIAAALALCGALFFSSCRDEGTVGPSRAGDFSTAIVEGLVLPEEADFTVTLGRGDSVVSTRTHGGYFQFRDIDYGLYILDIAGKGYGGFRQAVEVGEAHVGLGPYRLASVPWPLRQVIPSDSLVLSKTFVPAALALEFSRPMDKGSVESALSVAPSVPFSVHWEAPEAAGSLNQALRVEFAQADLRKDVVYRLSLGTEARTLAGARLERPLEYAIVNHLAALGKNDLVAFPLGSQSFAPAEPIPLQFSKPMDIASVAGRLVLEPLVAFREEWDLSRNLLHLVPETRWPAGGDLAISLHEGYTAADGTQGTGAEGEYAIEDFGMGNPRPGEQLPLADELGMDFNLPIDTATLRYRASGGVKAKAFLSRPDRLLWTFSGTVEGRAFTLTVDTLLSVYGDSLPRGTALTLVPGPADAKTFGFSDSARADAGFLPSRDTVRLACSRSAYLRLKASEFRLLPGFPVSTRWIPGEDGAVLQAWSTQPLPAGSAFRLFPATGEGPGDSTRFRTRALAAAWVRPFYGEEKVAEGEALVLRWNTFIDTAGFAAHVLSEPALASMEIAQDSAGGVTTTTIRHAGLAKGTRYSIRIAGATDLFGSPLADTLEHSFRTTP